MNRCMLLIYISREDREAACKLVRLTDLQKHWLQAGWKLRRPTAFFYLYCTSHSFAGQWKAWMEMKSSTLIFTFKSGSTPLLVGRRQGVRRGVKHLFLLLQLAPHLCWLVEGRVWDKEFNIYFYLYSCPHSFVGWRYTDRQPCCPPQCTGNQKDNWQSHRLMPLWSSYLHCSPLVVKKKKGWGEEWVSVKHKGSHLNLCLHHINSTQHIPT